MAIATIDENTKNGTIQSALTKVSPTENINPETNNMYSDSILHLLSLNTTKIPLIIKHKSNRITDNPICVIEYNIPASERYPVP